MLWVERQADKDSVDSLSRSLAVSSTLSRLLNLRGIELSEKAFEFLEPKLAHLASPFDIPHLRDAVELSSRFNAKKASSWLGTMMLME